MLLQTSIPWYQDPITVATWVIALATVLYFITTAALFFLTKRMFEASHRPFIGPVAVNMTDVQGSPNYVDIRVRYKNFGSIPAQEFKFDIELFADGLLLPNAIMEEEPVSVLMPTVDNFSGLMITDAAEYKLVHDAHTLTVTFKCSYTGAQHKRYTGETKWKYTRSRNQFEIIKGQAN